jgi:hypothetical protein
MTRLFSGFKKRDLLQVRGSTVVIKSKMGLEQLVSS